MKLIKRIMLKLYLFYLKYIYKGEDTKIVDSIYNYQTC